MTSWYHQIDRGMSWQEKEIRHLEKRLRTRDQQQADLQAKWNFHSFKYQLLIDMVKPCSSPSPSPKTEADHASRHAVLCTAVSHTQPMIVEQQLMVVTR